MEMVCGDKVRTRGLRCPVLVGGCAPRGLEKGADDNNQEIFTTLDMAATILVLCKPTGHVDERNEVVLFYTLIK